VLKQWVSLSIRDLPYLHYKWILENDTKFLSFSGFTPLGAQQEFQGQTKAQKEGNFENNFIEEEWCLLTFLGIIWSNNAKICANLKVGTFGTRMGMTLGLLWGLLS
jgi:hypothetical protein